MKAFISGFHVRQRQQPYFSSILGLLLGRLSCSGFWTLGGSNEQDILVHHFRVHKATDEAVFVVLHLFPDHVALMSTHQKGTVQPLAGFSAVLGLKIFGCST